MGTDGSDSLGSLSDEALGLGAAQGPALACCEEGEGERQGELSHSPPLVGAWRGRKTLSTGFHRRTGRTR